MSDRFNFDMTINAGNVITLVTILIGVIMAYAALTVKAQHNERQIIEINNIVRQIPNEYINRNEFIQQENRLTRIEQKLDRLIEIQIKSGN
jgi:hypothetical protein